MIQTPEHLFDNDAHAPAKPVLSVLIPFFRDDPCALLAALDREAPRLDDAVELVVLDDGAGDEALAARVGQTIAGLSLPARFVRLHMNEGRAKGRNRLTRHARGSAFLFLDADMLPDDERFLQSWATLVGHEDPAVAFGGFSLKQAPDTKEFAVHRRMALKGECVPFYERAKQPEKYVYTSNLLVSRAAFESEAFDDGFTGWGWEDVEWAMRIVQRFRVVHVDIPATHMGLDTAASLAGKYEQSVANFARVVGRHPEVVARYPSYRAARLLKKAPGLKSWRGLFKGVALSGAFPPATRAFSLRLYRAALYAEAV